MFKKQSKNDVIKAVNYIIFNKNEDFKKYIKFKEVQNKRFKTIVTIAISFLCINQIMLMLGISERFIEVVMYTELIMFFWSLFNLKKPYDEYKDIANMFSNQSIIDAFKENNIKKNGYLLNLDVDSIVCEKLP